jgi:hypothetical protein
MLFVCSKKIAINNLLFTTTRTCAYCILFFIESRSVFVGRSDRKPVYGLDCGGVLVRF